MDHYFLYAKLVSHIKKKKNQKRGKAQQIQIQHTYTTQMYAIADTAAAGAFASVDFGGNEMLLGKSNCVCELC